MQYLGYWNAPIEAIYGILSYDTYAMIVAWYTALRLPENILMLLVLVQLVPNPSAWQIWYLSF